MDITMNYINAQTICTVSSQDGQPSPPAHLFSAPECNIFLPKTTLFLLQYLHLKKKLNHIFYDVISL